MPNVDKAIIVYSEFEIYNLHKKILNKFSINFFRKNWFNIGGNHMIPINESNGKKSQLQKDSSFVINGGEIIQAPFFYQDKEDFFKKAKRLYIMDTNQKKYYITNDTIKKMREVLNT